jgi:hypothetical protein
MTQIGRVANWCFDRAWIWLQALRVGVVASQPQQFQSSVAGNSTSGPRSTVLSVSHSSWASQHTIIVSIILCAYCHTGNTVTASIALSLSFLQRRGPSKQRRSSSASFGIHCLILLRPIHNTNARQDETFFPLAVTTFAPTTYQTTAIETYERLSFHVASLQSPNPPQATLFRLPQSSTVYTSSVQSSLA